MKLKIFTSITVILFVWALSGLELAMTNSTGSPGGYTGSPFDGRTCGTNGGCHGGGVTDQEMISIDTPPTGYVPGTTYNVTVSVAKAGVNKFGFELSEEDSNGNAKGVLVATTATQLKQNGKSITHRSSSNAGTDSKAWTFEWTAPAQGSGTVDFYAAGNATNGNNMTSGDEIFKDELSVDEAPPASVNENEGFAQLEVFPNPATDFLVLSFQATGEKVDVDLFTINGQKISNLFSGKTPNGLFNQQFEVSELAAGIYFLRIQNGNKTELKRVVVR